MFVRSEVVNVDKLAKKQETVYHPLKQGDVCVNHAFKPQFEVLFIGDGKMWMMDLESNAIGIVSSDNPSKLVIEDSAANDTYGTFKVYGIEWR